MSLFGGNTGGGSGGGGLFGSNTNNNTGTGGGGSGLFGSSTNQTGNTGGGLFGSNTNQSNTTGGGLFGSSTTQNNTTGGGGLFGSNTNQSSNTGGGLFGSNTNQSSNTGGLFGSSTTQNKPAATGGLFGSSATQTGTAGGLFGGNTQNAPGSSGTLWGAQPNPAGNLGGLLNNNQNTSNTQNSAYGGTSLFGTQTKPAQSGQFGGQQQTQQQSQQQQQPFQSMYNPPTVTVGQFGHTMTQAQLQKLQFSGLSTVPNEKRTAEQVKTVALKWKVDNEPGTPNTTVLKTWLYNAVPKEYAPFYYPNMANGEDEASWEEALSQKPPPVIVDGKEINSTWVPTLCKGFRALGERAQMQATIIREMRARLHEMNNSLDTIMDTHQQRITVKIAAAKRQHQILSQRVLRLAVKVQTLRNRGYALDSAEENLRKTLISLEKQVMDPGFVGRQDEIWARMVSLRERARWLEEEGKRVTDKLNDQNRQGAQGTTGGVPEEVIAKTKKILKDYEGQLQHLSKELEDVKKEYAEWEESQKKRKA